MATRNTPRKMNISQRSRKINSEKKLINYIKTMLGHPLITVDVSDEQIKLAIDQSFQLFSSWALDGQQNLGFIISCNGNQDYILDDRVNSIQGISISDSTTSYGSGGSGTDLGGFGNIDINYIPYVDPTSGATSSLETGGSFGNYSATGVAGGVAGGPATSGNRLEQMETAYVMQVQSQSMNNMFGQSVSFDFNASTHILRLFEPYVGNIMIEASINYIPNPTNDDGYNHQWIKEYSLNLVKNIWGQNVGKYNNSLVGGAEINYDRMISESQETLDRLNEDLLNRFSEPLGIFSA